MKKLILILIVIILQTSLVFATHNPRLEIDPESWDFGNVTEAKILTYKFKVKNLGDDMLEIKHLTTSCGCVTASMPFYKLYPGEETYLTVYIDTQQIKTQGKIKRDIFIESNDSENPFKTITVSLELNIKEEVPRGGSKIVHAISAITPYPRKSLLKNYMPALKGEKGLLFWMYERKMNI